MSQQTELHEQFIKGVTWKMLITFVAGVISIVSTFVWGYSEIQNSIKDSKVEFHQSMLQLKYEFNAQIDSVQINQLREHYTNQEHFKDLENKIKK